MSDRTVVVNGWALFAHPLFLAQVEALTGEVEALKAKDPVGHLGKSPTKRLAAIRKLAFEVIPQEHGNVVYRQGGTLGEANRHWYRAKFFQQYRLFYRFDSGAKAIVYVWVNDEGTKRAWDSRTDAYAVFGRMLAGGTPPGDWEALMREAVEVTQE